MKHSPESSTCVIVFFSLPISGFCSFVPSPHREPKVVTIWFQNCRQNKRPFCLHLQTIFLIPGRPSIPMQKAARMSTSHSRSHSHSSSPYAYPPKSPLRCPMLETMALRSELHTVPPWTPLKRLHLSKSP